MSDIQINIRVNGNQAKRELDRVSRSTRAAQASTDSFARSLSQLRRVMGFLGFTVLVQGLTDYADGLVEAQNRLRFLISDTEQLAKTTQDLKQVADDTRSGFLESVELYQRMSLAARQLGVAQGDLLGVTKSINQAIILSGASAKEANNGLIQLSQGIAANRLGGDELRSVLEQLPVVADTIARELGITRGELRALGEQGKITGNVIIDAFKNSAELLDAEFGETVPTIGQALNVLKNNIIGTLGELNQSTGLFTNMSTAIITLSKNLKVVGTALLSVFGPVVFASINSGFVSLQEGARRALKGVTEELNKTQIAMRSAFAGLAIAAILFRDDIKLTEDSTVTLGDTVEQVFMDAGESIRIAGGLVAEEFSQAVAGVDLTGIQFGLQDAILFLGVFADTARNLFVGLAGEITNGVMAAIGGFLMGVLRIRSITVAAIDAMAVYARTAFSGVAASIEMTGAALEQAFKGNTTGAREMVEQAKLSLTSGFDAAGKASANAFNRALSTEIEADSALVAEIAGIADPIGAAMERALSGDQASTYVTDAVKDMILRAQQRVDAEEVSEGNRAARLAQLREEAQVIKTTAAALTDVTSKYEKQGEVLLAQIRGGRDYANVLKAVHEAERRIAKASKGRETLSEDVRKQIEGQVAYNNQLARVADLMEQVNGPQREMVANQRALRTALKDNVISLGEYHAALRLLKEEAAPENSFAAGLADGLQQVQQRVFDLTTSTSNAVQNVAQSTEDFLAGSIQATTGFIARLVEDGKVSFTDFRDTIRSLFADLITAMIQELSRLMAQRMMMQLLGMALGPAGAMGAMAGVSGEAASADTA